MYNYFFGNKEDDSYFKFKVKNTFLHRIRMSRNILKKYPDHIPIIVERYVHSDLKQISKEKFLFDKNLTVAHLIIKIRQCIDCDKSKAILISIKETFPPINEKLSDVYALLKDNDNFLYIKYSSENAYG